VVDASVFPSSSSVNPALTIMANALRVGDHLKERLGAAAPSLAQAPGQPIAAGQMSHAAAAR
jgi:choline dehydrogenase-like flavoprotein